MNILTKPDGRSRIIVEGIAAVIEFEPLESSAYPCVRVSLDFGPFGVGVKAVLSAVDADLIAKELVRAAARATVVGPTPETPP